MDYSAIERHCLALIFAIQKLHHYLVAHCLELVTRSNPLKYLLSRPAISERIAQRLQQLSEFDIPIVTPRRLQSQADLLAQFPSEEHEPLCEFLHEEVCRRL